MDPSSASASDAPVALPVPVQGQAVAVAKVVSGATVATPRLHGSTAKSSGGAHGTLTLTADGPADAASDAPAPLPVAAAALQALIATPGAGAPLQNAPASDAMPVLGAPEVGARGSSLRTEKPHGGGRSVPGVKATPVSATKDEAAQSASSVPVIAVVETAKGVAAEKDAAEVKTVLLGGHASDATPTHTMSASATLVADEPKGSRVPEPAPVATSNDMPGWGGGEARTLTATSQVLEVGVASGTHGWLRVRAELGGGGEVTASVVASSADAVKALHHEMPALGEYLAREHVGVASVAVSTAAGTALAADAGGERNDREQPDQQAFGHGSAKREAWDGGGLEGLFTMASAPALLNLNGGGGWVNVRV